MDKQDRQNSIIKSAWEIALEKIEKQKISQSEIDEMEATEIGKKIAGKFLISKKFNLQTEINRHPQHLRKYIKNSIEKILLLNVILPTSKTILKETRKSLEGIVMIKENKSEALKICAHIETILKQYKEERENYYSSLRSEISRKMEEIRKSVEEELNLPVKVDVESQPEFEKTWKEISSQLDQKYQPILDEAKEFLRSVK